MTEEACDCINAAYLLFFQVSDTTESPEKIKRVKKGKEPAKEKPKGKVCI